MKIRLTIRSKLMLAATLGTLAVVLVASFAAYHAARAGLEQKIRAHLESVTQSRAAHVSTFLRQHKNMIELAATSRVLRAGLRRLRTSGADKAAVTQDLNARLTTLNKPEDCIYDILLLDHSGQVVGSTNPKDIGQDKSTDAYFVGARREAFAKGPYVSKTTGRKGLALSAPLLDRKRGDMLGVIVARAEMVSLDAICTDRTGLGKTGETYLINKYGFAITPSRFQGDTFLKLKVSSENARTCLADQQAVRRKTLVQEHEHEAGVFLDYRGVRILGTHAHIPEMEWGLLAEIDADEAFAPITSLKRTLSTVALLAVAFALALAWALARGIAGPIRQLSEGSERIGAGEFDHRLDIQTGDEIERLAERFNWMADQLSDSYEVLENKVAERTAELHRLQQQVEFILGATKTGLDIIDSEFNVRYIDPEWEKAYGPPAGRKCYEYFMGRDEVCPGCGIVKALKTKTACVTEEVLPKEGNRPVQVTTMPFQAENGEWLVAEVNVDITERKNAQLVLEEHAKETERVNAELAASNQNLKEFTYAVSHDLQEPLRKVHTFAQFLVEDCGEHIPEEGKDHLRRMQHATVRMKELIYRLLQLSRVDTRGTELAATDPAEVIAHVLDTLSESVKDKRATIDVQPGLPKVMADATQLEQVFQNLIGNALKFHSPGRDPHVRITAHREDGRVTFVVSDNGIGMPERFLGKIFGVFQRLHPRDRYAGAGVGLALCKRIVQRHGGRIWAKSEQRNGSRFHFTLRPALTEEGEES